MSGFLEHSSIEFKKKKGAFVFGIFFHKSTTIFTVLFHYFMHFIRLRLILQNRLIMIISFQKNFFLKVTEIDGLTNLLSRCNCFWEIQIKARGRYGKLRLICQN